MTKAVVLGILACAVTTRADATGNEVALGSLDLINAPEVLDVKFSPDGSRVLYEVRRTDYEGNRYLMELWLVAVDGDDSPKRLLVGPPANSRFQSLQAQWAPDGESIIYFSRTDNSSPSEGSRRLFTYAIADGHIEPMFKRSVQAFNSLSGSVSFCQFSPDGRFLAIAFAELNPEEATGGLRGIVSDVHPFWPVMSKKSNTGLWLLDIKSDAMRRMTPPTMHVGDLAWSPDSKRLAFASAPSPEMSPYMDDLYVLDIGAGEITALIEQPGWERNPVWSPDGRWIAFATQKGKQDWNYRSWIGLISPEAANLRYLFDDLERDAGSSMGLGRMSWMPDGRSVVFDLSYRGEIHLFRGWVDSGEVKQITPKGKYYGSKWRGSFSLSPDGRHIAVAVQDVAHVSDVYLGSVPWETPRKLAETHPQWPVSKPIVETIRWRSRDNRFWVEGVVIKPSSFDSNKRYPTIVALMGGPSMVHMSFMLDETYPYLAMAEKGYVVFAPNSRGRGGFGASFRVAMPENSDYLPGPYDDVMAGVDELIARGIADPERLAIAGHSYGGTLTSYIMTRTSRFKAAAVFEGFPNNIQNALYNAGREKGLAGIRDQRGFGSPWDPADFQVLKENSPIFHMHTARTPVLLEYGEISGAPVLGAEFYGVLRFFDIPSVFTVYPRTGHFVEEPKLRLDSYARQIAWFDYWLLGLGDNPTELH